MAEGGIQIRVESQGIDELKEIFDKLPAKVAKRPLQSTLRRAAKPLEQEVKNTLPVRLKDMGQAVTTKNMRSFAGVKTGVYTKRVAVMIGSEGKEKQWDAYYLLYWHNLWDPLQARPITQTKKGKNIQEPFIPRPIHPRRFIQKGV